jgi:putative transposase
MINAIKQYVEYGAYHVYNRGVNEQNIFFCEKDYETFLFLLQRYLIKQQPFSKTKNYSQTIDLLIFCLMPTHYHLLIRQKDAKSMVEFAQSLSVSFTAIINKRHSRVGHLFQGVYKARLIKDDADLLNISKYIHLNPMEKDIKEALDYPYSSIKSYISDLPSMHWDFVNTNTIFTQFNNSKVKYLEFLKGET